MKITIISSSLVLAFVLATPVASHAQVITQGTFTDLSVLSEAGGGTEVSGLDFGGPTETFGAYTFYDSSSSISLTALNVPFSGFLTDGNTSTQIVTTGNSDFDNVVGSGFYPNGGNTGTLTLSGLTQDTTYTTLIFSDDDRVNNSGAGATSIADGSQSSTPISDGFPNGTGTAAVTNPYPGTTMNQFEGLYMVDTFTTGASETSHDITFSGSYINAVLVTQTPEPSTYALVALGLATLVFVLKLRSRRQSA